MQAEQADETRGRREGRSAPLGGTVNEDEEQRRKLSGGRRRMSSGQAEFEEERSNMRPKQE